MRGARLAGNPLHPALVHFPVAAWTLVVVADAAVLLSASTIWWQIGYWGLVVGTVTALAAMAAGLIELVALSGDHPAWPDAMAHMLAMGGAWLIFAVDLILRIRMPQDTAPIPALAALTTAGFAALLAGGHFGGRLVYHHGLGREATDD